MRSLGRIIAFGAVGLVPSGAWAQAEPAPAAPELTISADRPGFYEGTGTVPPFHLQLESGVSFTTDSSADVRAWNLPQATLRFGLTAWGEVFVDLPSWNHVRADGAGTEEGVGDVVVGFKARCFEQAGARPNFTLIGEMGLPTGDHPFTLGQPSPRVVAAASWGLGGGLNLVVNGAIGFPGAGDDQGHFLQASTAIALEIPVADRLGAYVESFALYRANGGPPPEQYADGGFTFLLTPRVQLDASVTFGLNAHAVDLSVGAGISVLF